MLHTCHATCGYMPCYKSVGRDSAQQKLKVVSETQSTPFMRNFKIATNFPSGPKRTNYSMSTLGTQTLQHWMYVSHHDFHRVLIVLWFPDSHGALIESSRLGLQFKEVQLPQDYQHPTKICGIQNKLCTRPSCACSIQCCKVGLGPRLHKGRVDTRHSQ